MSLSGTDLWVASIAPFHCWESCLAEKDWSEASGYTSAESGRRFLLARSRLRAILSACTGIPAARLGFARGRYGKPRLASGQGRRLHFNASHSRDLLAVAVSAAGPVGIDIEHARRIDSAWLAESWFSPREYASWRWLPAGFRHDAFFRLWCRKEAFIKALGLGLAMPLDQFSVSHEAECAELLEVRGRRPRRWRMAAIDAGPGCAGALVTRGETGPIRRRELL